MTAQERATRLVNKLPWLTENLSPAGKTDLPRHIQAAIEAVVEEEFDRCAKTVDLFSQLTLSDLESDEAEALRDGLEEVHGSSGAYNPIMEPIGVAVRKAVKEEREACAKILDKEAEYNSGENEGGYVNGDAEDSCRRLADAIRKRGKP